MAFVWQTKLFLVVSALTEGNYLVATATTVRPFPSLSSHRQGSETFWPAGEEVDCRCVRLSVSSLLTGESPVKAAPVQEFFSLKPQLNLPLSSFHWVAGMDHIPVNIIILHSFALNTFLKHTVCLNYTRLPADMKAEIPSDCAGLGLGWVSVAHHHTGRLNHILSFPHLKQK